MTKPSKNKDSDIMPRSVLIKYGIKYSQKIVHIFIFTWFGHEKAIKWREIHILIIANVRQREEVGHDTLSWRTGNEQIQTGNEHNTYQFIANERIRSSSVIVYESTESSKPSKNKVHAIMYNTAHWAIV